MMKKHCLKQQVRIKPTDAGAPVELDEIEKLEEVLPVIWEELALEARAFARVWN